LLLQLIYFAFQLIQTFFVASLAGSVTSALATVNEVGDVFRYLAKTLPPKSVYFMQLVLIQTVIGLGSELLRTTALIQAFFRSRIGPRVTEKDRSEPFIGLRPFCNPRYFLHAQSLAGICLRYMVLFTFAVLSPFVCYILLFSFVVTEIGFRHQFIYIYPSTLDSGGQLWLTFTAITMVCILVAEIILLTFMALSKAQNQSYALCPLILSTVIFCLYIRQRHFTVAKYLSLETCDEVDEQNNFQKISSNDLKFLSEKFLQPELIAMRDILKETVVL
jgi:calcium permeable stress-gated cation channel